MANQDDKIKIITDNRQARHLRHLYEILETFEAGVQLLGTEVKSVRAGKVNLRDGYVLVRNGEAVLINVHISPYEQSSEYFNHDPRRTRKLLMHKKEISKLIGQVEQKGLTLGVKISIGLGRGKKLHDKREDLKRRQDQRDMARAMKR